MADHLFCGQSEGDAAAMPLVVAIVEGAVRGLFDAAAQLGHAPWWMDHCVGQSFCELPCGPAPYEPSNLATAFTGTGRGEHGCYSYWRMSHDEGLKPQLLTSADVHRQWLWNWAELDGLRKAVLNVQLTHPPQPMEGVMLSYLMNQSLRFSYPPTLASDLHRTGMRYGHDVSAFYRGEGAEWFLERTRDIASRQIEAALELGAKADLMVVNLTLIDRISHFFWHDFAQDASTSDAPCPLLVAYQETDRSLARLHRLAGGRPMLIFSEIGFGPLEGFVSIDDLLVAEGFLELDGDLRSISNRAHARETPQGSHGIVCRERDGSRSLALVDDVIDFLASVRRTDGKPMFQAIWQGEELYRGSQAHRAPDIVVDPSDPARPPLGDRRWATHVNRTLQTGWHRNEGFLRILDPGAAQTRAYFQLSDVAPTIVALLGRDPPPDIEGRAFGRSLEGVSPMQNGRP